MKIPPLGLGTYKLQGKLAQQAVRQAFDIGYRHIDTATAYSNEEVIGKTISSFPRDQLFLTSKLWVDVQNPKHVEKACDESLHHLGTSYLDLYLLHWPKHDTFLDLLGTMQKLVEKGKVISIGISNATVGHLQEIVKAHLPISMNQVECHPFFQQKELLAFCKKNQIGLTAYCPIARGEVHADSTIKTIGSIHHKTAAQVALRWLFQRGIVSIPKASSEKHLIENFHIFDFELSPKEMKEIDSIPQHPRQVSPEWNEFSY